MKTRPIPFTDVMIRAILENQKTQTRRPFRVQPPKETLSVTPWMLEGPDLEMEWQERPSGLPLFISEEPDRTNREYACPYGKPGDRLWCKEAWRDIDCDCLDCQECRTAINQTKYRADADGTFEKQAEYNTPRFMPRCRARIILEIVSVRAERVSEISGDDAIAEGAKHLYSEEYKARYGYYPAGIVDGVCSQRRFIALWGEIHSYKTGNYWANNPWVWVIEFKLISTTGEDEIK